MGDILSLVEKAEATLDRKKSEEFAKKALLGDGFTLEDFRDQLKQIKKLGSMESILKMLPSVGPFAGMQQAAQNVDEKQFVRLEAIINSMTPKERHNHEIISGIAPEADRGRVGHQRPGCEPASAPVCADEQDVQADGKGGLAKQMMRGGMVAWLVGSIGLLFVGFALGDSPVDDKAATLLARARLAWRRQVEKETATAAATSSVHPPIRVDPEMEKLAARLAEARLRRSARGDRTPALSRADYNGDEDENEDG